MQIDTLSPKKSDFLKLIAIITMLIDHIGHVLMPHTSDAYIMMKVIGRIAFPIFAYSIAVGYVHTRSFPKYLLRLVIFALISQIPFYWAQNGQTPFFDSWSNPNIFFTLSLGLLAIECYELLCKNEFCKKFFITFVPVALFAFIAEFFNTDYGFYGVLMIFVCYMSRYQPALALVGQLFLAIGLCLVDPRQFRQIFCMLGFFAIYKPFLKQESYPVVKLNKYFFYSFYPVHLMILYYIKFHML